MSTPSDRVYLMYHEIELPGRPLCQDEPGYVRYIVREADFREQLRAIKSRGWRGLTVSEALEDPSATGVVITFDDGCETDLITAAPLLRELGFNATFYVTVGFLGTRGYMSRLQLRELSDLGLEIGSHSLTHPYLSDLTQDQLTHEIDGSKQELELITGRAIHHFSCPGGRWDSRVPSTAKQAGYRSVATSRFVANSAATDPFALGRVAIMRTTGLDEFNNLADGRGLWQQRLWNSARAFGKNVLGNALYDQVRALLLRRKPQTR